MLVVEEEDPALLQRGSDPVRPALEVAELGERAPRGVDDVEALAPQLDRERLGRGGDEGRVRQPLPRRHDRLLRGVDPGHERAEAHQGRRLAARAAGEVQDVAPANVGKPLAHRLGQRAGAAGGGAPDLLVRLLPGTKVALGGLHQAKREKPPSTIRVCPRTISAAGEQRNTTASATSPGSKIRPAGVQRNRRASSTSRGSTSRPAGVRFKPEEIISARFGKCSSAPVSTTPAETALTRIPRGASSTAR